MSGEICSLRDGHGLSSKRSVRSSLGGLIPDIQQADGRGNRLGLLTDPPKAGPAFASLTRRRMPARRRCLLPGNVMGRKGSTASARPRTLEQILSDQRPAQVDGGRTRDRFDCPTKRAAKKDRRQEDHATARMLFFIISRQHDSQFEGPGLNFRSREINFLNRPNCWKRSTMPRNLLIDG